MKKNMIIAGLVATVIMIAAFGVVLAQDDAMVQDPALEEPMSEFDAIYDEVADEDANYLITQDQMGEIRNETRNMIREQIRENLVEYGMTDEEILELEENMDAIHELEKEVRETIRELRDEGLSRDEIRSEVETQVTEIQALRELVKEKLDEYDIVLPPRLMGHKEGIQPGPGFGEPGDMKGGRPGMDGGMGRRPGGPGMGGPGMGDHSQGMPGNGEGFMEPRP